MYPKEPIIMDNEIFRRFFETALKSMQYGLFSESLTKVFSFLNLLRVLRSIFILTCLSVPSQLKVSHWEMPFSFSAAERCRGAAIAKISKNAFFCT